MDTLFTIGHSNHPTAYFLEMLEAHHIDCIVDVRSIPVNKYNPQYNQPALRAVLAQKNIQYLHFPESFGARQTDPSLLDEHGQVDFDKVRRSDAFRTGVRRVETGLERGFRIALLCAEANPLECHRFAMVAVHFARTGFTVLHILKDKSLCDQEAMEALMLEKYRKKLPKPSLFEPDISEKDHLHAAYRFCNNDIGWSASANANEEEKE